MKTIEQVQAEMEFGDVFKLEEFASMVTEGYLIPDDGVGYFHDGEKETNISVWNTSLKYKDIKRYPYVCWYNK